VSSHFTCPEFTPGLEGSQTLFSLNPGITRDSPVTPGSPVDSKTGHDCRVQTLHVIDRQSETNSQQQQQQQQQVYTVKALSSDTIAQLKDKILDTIYRYVPFSLRPDSSELDLGN